MRKSDQDFWETLRQVNESFDIMRNYCIGECDELITDGCGHSYTQRIKTDENGVCLKCGQLRYRKGMPPKGRPPQLVEAPKKRWKWLCAFLGHPEARIISSPPGNDKWEKWCPNCNVYWFELKDGIMPRP